MNTPVLTPALWSAESSHGLTWSQKQFLLWVSEFWTTNPKGAESKITGLYLSSSNAPKYVYISRWKSLHQCREQIINDCFILSKAKQNYPFCDPLCKSGVPFTCSFAWFRVLMQTPPDKKSANKRSADYMSLHPLLSVTSPPLLLCQHVALWGRSDLDKVFSNPGRKEPGCVLWPHDPGSLSSSAQTHRCVHWHGEGRTARVGTRQGCGRLGNCPCWCCLNSGSTKWQPQPLQARLSWDRLS